MIGRLGFGERLRAHRERQGISLRSIADSTKIKHSLLEALERGNVSQWPQGLYRRAYLRDYATAIGLPPEPLLAEFLRLFPEDGTDPTFDTTPASLQLTLDAPPIGLRVAQRAGKTGVEVAGVAFVAGIVSSSPSLTFLEALGVVAMCYYPIAMMLVERASVLRQLKALATRSSIGGVTSTAEAPNLEPARLYVVGREQAAPAFQAVTDDNLAQGQTASR